jgi:drug/metabolite transporter (DMT)-like permease
MKPQSSRCAAFAVPVLALLWGLNWPAVRVVLSWWSPWTLRAVGLGASALILFALALARGERLTIAPGQRLRLCLSALLTIAGFNLCTAFAQTAGSTSRAAIVTFTMPVWAVIFAWLLIHEKPDRWRTAAVFLGIAGLTLLAAPLLASGASLRGPLFALGAGLSWAAGTVYVKRWPIAAPPIAGTAWQLAFGAAVSTLGGLLFGSMLGITPEPVGIAAHNSASTATVYPALWFAIALGFHVIFATALAYLIWFDVVARLPAGVAALGTLLVPVVGVAGAMSLLGERLALSDLGGFGLIIAAAALALLAPRAASS